MNQSPSPVSRATAWMRGARGLRPGVVVAIVAFVTLFIAGSLTYAVVSRTHKPATPALDTTTAGTAEPAGGTVGSGVAFLYPSAPPEPSPSPRFMLTPRFPLASPTPFARASFQPYRNSPAFSPAPYTTPAATPPQMNAAYHAPPLPIPTRGPSSSVVAFSDPDAAAPATTGGSTALQPQTQSDAGSDGRADVPPLTADAGDTTGSIASAAIGGGARSSASFVSDRQASSGDASTPSPSPTPIVATNGPNAVGYVRRLSAFQIGPTTVLTCRLRSKIVSDLPGPFICEITKPIYDSTTHDTEVIPAGTMVYSTYSTGLINGQNRLAAAGAELVFGDGREFLIGNQAYTDAQGAAGITGDVDAHRGAVYGAAFILTSIAAASAAIDPQTGGSAFTTPNIGQQARSSAGEQVTNTGTQLIGRNLQRAPTIVIRPPNEITMIVARDLPLDAFEVKR